MPSITLSAIELLVDLYSKQQSASPYFIFYAGPRMTLTYGTYKRANPEGYHGVPADTYRLCGLWKTRVGDTYPYSGLTIANGDELLQISGLPAVSSLDLGGASFSYNSKRVYFAGGGAKTLYTYVEVPAEATNVWVGYDVRDGYRWSTDPEANWSTWTDISTDPVGTNCLAKDLRFDISSKLKSGDLGSTVIGTANPSYSLIEIVNNVVVNGANKSLSKLRATILTDATDTRIPTTMNSACQLELYDFSAGAWVNKETLDGIGSSIPDPEDQWVSASGTFPLVFGDYASIAVRYKPRAGVAPGAMVAYVGLDAQLA